MARAAASRRAGRAACASKGTRPHDEDAVSAPAVIRRFRRRRGLALSGEARDPILLVSDLAGAARRAGARQQADRRPAGAAAARRRPAARRRLRAGGDAHLDPVLRLRRQGRRGAEGRQSRAQDRAGRRQGRGRAGSQPRRRRARSISSPARSSISPAARSPRGAHSPRSTGSAIATRPAAIVHNRARAVLEDMDQLPFVTEVYKRDLKIEDYFIGYLKHPYLSLYTGRGCRSKCTFCLWPQTVGGHRYRVRSVEHVIEEIRLAKSVFPAGQGVLLRRRHLHRRPAARRGDRPRTRQARRHLVVQRQGQRAARDARSPARQRLAAVAGRLRDRQPADPATTSRRGCASTSPAALRRIATSSASRSTAPSSSGLPGETKETIEETIRFAAEINPHTIQVSLAAPYPGTELYRQAVDQGWLDIANAELIDDHGVQIAPLHYPHLSHTEIFQSLETFYRRFYFRRQQDRLAGGRDGPEPADDAPPAARGGRVLPVPAPARDGRLTPRPG